MPKTVKPHTIILHAYQVGFGDCFLLTFQYKTGDRHVLIDFGSTGQPGSAGDNLLVRVAEDIREKCNGKLHAVIATHRHKDHISGFATRKDGNGPGDIIASCKPTVVIQPWTEDPKAQPDATRPTTILSNARGFTASLHSMHAISEWVVLEAQRSASKLSKSLLKQLSFLGEDNISNRSAVENLMNMSRRHAYIHFGSKSGLEGILPGVKTHVLGPPTLEQSEEIGIQRAKDDAEFWHLQAEAGRFLSGKSKKLFNGEQTYSAAHTPPYTRWFIRRMDAIRGEQLLGIVRALDSAMNNTSIILLFEVGRKKLLFPGDAQIENWSYALSKPEICRLLKDVNLYKVGHHGSLNATPKTLWELFVNRSRKQSINRLKTINSTMANKHGSEARGTEVPRKKLIAELQSKSNYFSTQELKGRKNISEEFVIEI
jgi:hypothetical protein